MASIPTFRTIRSYLAPRWLTEGEGGKVGYALDLIKDAYRRRIELGHIARFPAFGVPPDALAATGRDRRLVRGRVETDAAYAVRLARWLDDRRTAGSPFALTKKIAEYVGISASGVGPVVKTVDNSGNWFQRSATGVNTAYLQAGNWNWDGSASQWARFWVIVHAFAPSAYNWGDITGPSWGQGTTTPGSTLGSTATYDDVQAMRAIIADWRPIGTKCMHIILAFDPASFNPAGPSGPPLPDGLWGAWSKQVGGVQVPSRLGTARYIDGG